MTWHNGPRAERKTILVTGANAGIGYFTAEQLAATGATVVLGCRDTAKGELAVQAIRARVPDARLRCVRMDLADLSSLPATVDDLDVDSMDAVVLNAGAYLSGPERRISAQGHELMFATNHLGHFALVAHLMPILTATANSRVITVGSFAARSERLDLSDLQSERDHQPKLRTIEAGPDAVRVRAGSPPARARCRHRQHCRPSRWCFGLTDPVAATAVRPHHRPAPARTPRRHRAARQTRGRHDRCPNRSGRRDNRRATLGAKGLRSPWPTSSGNAACAYGRPRYCRRTVDR